jgi:hypothetical protein
MEFLGGIRRALGDRERAVLYFEVPNILYTLEDLGIWDILYEHCSYFSPVSLRELFLRCGFRVLRTSVEYKSQFIGIEAAPGVSEARGNGDDESSVEVLSLLVEGFADEYRRKVEGWNRKLESLRRNGRRAVVWGAGTKGNMFLNTIRDAAAVEFVVDINPRKEGRYMSGTGRKIIGPELVKDLQPDVVVVMNPAYMTEIQQTVQGLRLTPEFLTA